MKTPICLLLSVLLLGAASAVTNSKEAIKKGTPTKTKTAFKIRVSKYSIFPDNPNADKLPIKNFKIVIAPAALPVVVFAAKELQQHLFKISGANVPIITKENGRIEQFTIYVGSNQILGPLNNRLKKLAKEEFVIKRLKNSLIIAGMDENGPPVPAYDYAKKQVIDFGRVGRFYKNKQRQDWLISRGTMHAVYTFLEDYAKVRWYWPGEIGTVILKSEYLYLPKSGIDRQEKPDMNYRMFHELLGNDVPDATPYDYLLYFARNKIYGSEAFVCNHTFNQWPERFAKSNPDWFATLANGKKAYYEDNKHRSAFCYTHPGVKAQQIKDIDNYFAGRFNLPRASKKYIAIMPNDAHREQHSCVCPRCLSKRTPEKGPLGVESEIYWDFFTTIAKKYLKSKPEITFTCCAYQTYQHPPNKIKFPKNTIVQICPGPSGQFDLDKPLTDFWAYKSLADWDKIEVRKYLWLYYNPRNHAGLDLFANFSKHIEKLFHSIDGKGYEGAFVQVGNKWKPRAGIFNTMWLQDHLTYYLVSKAMWDTKLDTDKILNEYYKLFYGPASADMAVFFETLQDAWTGITKKMAKTHAMVTTKNLYDNQVIFSQGYSDKRIQIIVKALRAAKQQTKKFPGYHKRVLAIEKAFRPVYTKYKKYKNTQTDSQIIAYKFKTPPRIDGKLGEKEWDQKIFVELNAKNVIPEKFKQKLLTKVSLGWDDNYLYACFIMNEPDIDKLEKRKMTRDLGGENGIWKDHSGEFFLSGGKGGIYHIIFNYGESIYDAKYTGAPALSARGSWDKNWNSNIQIATGLTADGWIAEIRIPLKDMNLNPRKMSEYSIKGNLHRHRPGTNVQLNDIIWEFFRTMYGFKDTRAHEEITFSPREKPQELFKLDFNQDLNIKKSKSIFVIRLGAKERKNENERIEITNKKEQGKSVGKIKMAFPQGIRVGGVNRNVGLVTYYLVTPVKVNSATTLSIKFKSAERGSRIYLTCGQTNRIRIDYLCKSAGTKLNGWQEKKFNILKDGRIIMKPGQQFTEINKITLRIESPLNYEAQEYTIKIAAIKLTE
ncbi:MAG: DUF4838 domain-containing protein [Victivallaceae bacterium]|nr:DUF4838 domain-containing protein [Victivallaceae bacterium]